MDFYNNRVIRYLKESKDELKKVVWPTRQETVRNTLLVIGVSVGVAVFLGLIDYIFNLGLTRLIER